jgi:hypothetical protein
MLIMQLKRYAELYAETTNGKWLNDFDWQSVPIITISKLPGDVVGMYSFGRIVILDTNVEIIFSTYIHELRHRWQWKTSPLKYILGKFYRPLIENDADNETEKSDCFIIKAQQEGL